MASDLPTFTTLIEVLQYRVKCCSDAHKPAYIFRDKYGGRRELSWQQCYDLGGRFAAELRSGSIGRGDFVLNTLVNSPERVIAETGILMSGAASVNGHCQLADGSDLLHTLRKSRAQAIVLDPDVHNSPWNVLQKHVSVDENGEATSTEFSHLKKVYFIRRNPENIDTSAPPANSVPFSTPAVSTQFSGGRKGTKWINEDFLIHLKELPDFFVADVKPDDVLSVFTTSGTTGFSKLVQYKHRSWAGGNSFSSARLTEFNIGPMGWTGGYVGSVYTNGYTRVTCDVRNGGIPEDLAAFTWKAIQEEKCTSTSLLPSVILQIAEKVLELENQDKEVGKLAEKLQNNSLQNGAGAHSCKHLYENQKSEENGRRTGTLRKNKLQYDDRASSSKNQPQDQESEIIVQHKSAPCCTVPPLSERQPPSRADLGMSVSVQESDQSQPGYQADLGRKEPVRKSAQAPSSQDQPKDQTSDDKTVQASSSRDQLKDQMRDDTYWKLECIVIGGMPVSRDVVKAAYKIAESVMIIYGGTDIGFVSALSDPDPETYSEFDSGKIIPFVEVKIVGDDDETTPLLVGKTGNILVKHIRQPTVQYVHDPEATAAAYTADGFFRTGDVGCLDDRGHLLVQGRGSDAIMRGPYIFNPGWLEARIRACPGVSDVVVVGVPDPLINEELCACLVLTSDDVTVEEVRQFVEKDILASEEDPLSPRPRHYLKFQSFPLTASNKPRRKAVKEKAAARLKSPSL